MNPKTDILAPVITTPDLVTSERVLTLIDTSFGSLTMLRDDICVDTDRSELDYKPKTKDRRTLRSLPKSEPLHSTEASSRVWQAALLRMKSSCSVSPTSTVVAPRPGST